MRLLQLMLMSISNLSKKLKTLNDWTENRSV
jgi:hypothetical protein